jgi:hypothetical protein
MTSGHRGHPHRSTSIEVAHTTAAVSEAAAITETTRLPARRGRAPAGRALRAPTGRVMPLISTPLLAVDLVLLVLLVEPACQVSLRS